eukprot:gnl/TRDRNA2_/TRDRNA2_177077_c1_seq1.p1 gnl/TRDRNA2_/TRDRNA2_177077_c1~~gnl/TRDRNA2_/TRDRNA2_177077_c1_seq1.p1  ORF type:complete len:191 (-),score=6.09 gnl/TRDRNA2_/TRDRNA2_177077_c1_seq1:258-830(-)
MTSDTPEFETISQLTQSACLLAVVNITLTGVERLAASSSNTRNIQLDYDPAKIYNEIQKQKSIEEKEIKKENKGERESPSAILTKCLFPNFQNRLEEARQVWNYKNDNSKDWNEWANRNLEKARDICLEAEYFFGDGKILPKTWEKTLDGWNDHSKGDASIDSCTYQPKIFDEPESGPIQLTRLGFSLII